MIHDLHLLGNERVHFTAQLDTENDTAAAGAAVASGLTPGLAISLEGDLGAGKTTLVRGTLRALGHTGRVKSPTYTLIEPYVVSRLNLYHFDFYRFQSPEEYLEAGLDEYFESDGVCLVEWPSKAHPLLAKPDVEICLRPAGGGRQLETRALTEAGQKCAQKILSTLQSGPLA